MPGTLGSLMFHHLFPEIGLRETRTATTLGAGGMKAPEDVCWFHEAYCVDPACDCRSVVISVWSDREQATLATISHAFEPPKGRKAIEDRQTFLDPLNPQSRRSKELLGLFEDMLGAKDYRERLVHHYRMVKDAVATPGHPIHARMAMASRAIGAPSGASSGPVVEPYAPCPCGSGKKYKFCCRASR